MATPARVPWAVWLAGTVCLGVGVLGGAGWLVGRAPVWSAAEPATVLRVVATPSLAPVVERAGPAVVAIAAFHDDVSQSDRADKALRAPGLSAASAAGSGVRKGSGFVVHADGLIVTARHVVMGARQVRVTFQHQDPCAAELVGEDAVSDLAVLRLVDPPGDLQVLSFGRSEDLRAGDWIVAIGNPFGFAQTVTAGVVSFVGRHLPNAGFGVTTDFLQFSAAVHPGSSGCPVLDLHGNVVGVTTQAADEAQSLSFAVPSRTVTWVLDALDRHGHVRRGFLGVQLSLRRVTDGSGQVLEGALVEGVAAGGPADRAGVRPGDRILDLDGQRIAAAGDLHDRVTRTLPGARVRIGLLRQGRQPASVDLTVDEVGVSLNADQSH